MIWSAGRRVKAVRACAGGGMAANRRVRRRGGQRASRYVGSRRGMGIEHARKEKGLGKDSGYWPIWCSTAATNRRHLRHTACDACPSRPQRPQPSLPCPPSSHSPSCDDLPARAAETPSSSTRSLKNSLDALVTVGQYRSGVCQRA